MYKIAIIEDHAILKAGLCAILSKDPQFNIISQPNDPIELFRHTWTVGPDLVLLNLIMPKMNGIEAIEEIKKRWQWTKILVYTNKEEEKNILEAFQAGADGYLLKNSPMEELISAIKKILAGYYHVSDIVLTKIMNRYLLAEKMLSGNQLHTVLTTRERELFKLIIEGFKNREIADSLCISIKTVETHRTNLMKKLNVHNVVELISVAEEFGLSNYSSERQLRSILSELVPLAQPH
jgi:DNA-binding NarL/FixJ family response regulator